MTATVYTLTESWSASNRYTASGETDVLLSNTQRQAAGSVVFTTTTSDTAPTIATHQGHVIRPAGSHAMTLNDGERLWVALVGQSTGTATLEV